MNLLGNAQRYAKETALVKTLVAMGLGLAIVKHIIKRHDGDAKISVAPLESLVSRLS
ncbi:hypothetical protein LNL84_05895 [Vibrio sp. ZSDZ34]|uniref:Uncharacterized protein n=1 Tax=Vibrio gelatinilyticus TaxID=2893468 RepID=A0A9X1WGP5_9VIBR|nr:hypothetical protein [Vibrio gelatinilyticus]MCJ2376364.1 hypothetical protein [Vibrio gelatinilyticus]